MLLGWEIVGWAVALFISIGVGVLGLNEFKSAKFCFAFVAALLWTKTAVWGVDTNLSFSNRGPLLVIAFGLLGLCLVESWRWIDKKGVSVTLPAQTVPEVSPPAPLPPSAEQRILLPEDITPAYLSGLYNANTELQADRLAGVYVGKWMSVSGSVVDIQRSYRGLVVLISIAKDKVIGRLVFDNRWDDRVSVLKRGSEVKAVGKLYLITSGALSLQDCEFN